MKKFILPVFTAALLIGTSSAVQAQSYRTSLGVGIDVGDGPTLGGPQIKHFFDSQNAGNAQVLFGDNVTLIGVDYSYNQAIRGARGLSWYVGIGPQIAFLDNDNIWFDDDHRDNHTHVAIRPAIGLEFKIPSAPLAFHFDWKPWWNLTHNSSFEPSRFTLGFKFTLK
ncbi:hypothetical protein SAMN05660841_01095 [Sphingobacterium nematocida]|uniref:Outer membrane protein beta-barrel domain-containing protein n=1 Tax=Sphingobacterium nematocida TaxID=1513896 RepID=A0A1T5C4P2_9SPHI|nr:hypothetical protein [Sphingobacterium nematocida]SKB54120.1 hypothetical protein SAMN05660841_01095 [Sphingobacterium nematocida]